MIQIVSKTHIGIPYSIGVLPHCHRSNRHGYFGYDATHPEEILALIKKGGMVKYTAVRGKAFKL